MTASPRSIRLWAVTLALAAAALALVGGRRPVTRVLVIDASRSCAASGRWLESAGRIEFEGDGVDHVVFFGRDVRMRPSGPAVAVGETEAIGGGVDPSASDLGAALLEAFSLVPGDHTGEVLVVTDGRDTVGGVPAALAEARRRGIAVAARAPVSDPFFAAPARIAAVNAPSTARAGDRLPVEVRLVGGDGSPVTVALEDTATGHQERRTVRVQDGGRIVMDAVARDVGVHRFLVHTDPPVGEPASVAVLVGGGVEVLRVGGGPATGDVSRWLTGLPGVTLRDVHGDRGIEEAFRDLDPRVADLVVLDDLSLARLRRSPEAIGLLRDAVLEGTGLLLLGGPSTLGAGGWAHGEMELVLPVVCAPARPAPLVVLALDLSGSMARGPRPGEARAAAVRLVRAAPRDAVLAFVPFCDETLDVAGPFDLSVAEEQVAAVAEVSRVLEPAGGTRFGAAVDGALAAATTTGSAGTRLLLLVTDGQPADALVELERQGERLAAARFETVILPLAGATDAARIAAFAGAASARVVPAQDLEDGDALGDVLVAAVSTAAPDAWVERPSMVTAGPVAPPWGTVGAGLPSVAGHDRVRARPEASTWLSTVEGDPLLVAGTRGAGRVVVAAWQPSGEWTRAPAASLLEQAAAWATRRPGDRDVRAVARVGDDGLMEVEIRFPAGTTPPREVTVAGVGLRPVDAVTWSGVLEAPPSDTGVVGVLADGRPVARAAVVRAVALEDRAVGSDVDALRALRVPATPPSPSTGAGIPSLIVAVAAILLLVVAGLRESGFRNPPPSVEGTGQA